MAVSCVQRVGARLRCGASSSGSLPCRVVAVLRKVRARNLMPAVAPWMLRSYLPNQVLATRHYKGALQGWGNLEQNKGAPLVMSLVMPL